MKDERNVSKMEGKTNFSRRLKQFDGSTRLTLTPSFYDRSTPLSLPSLLQLPTLILLSKPIAVLHFYWTNIIISIIL